MGGMWKVLEFPGGGLIINTPPQEHLNTGEIKIANQGSKTALQYSLVPGLFIGLTAAKTMDRTFLTPGGGLDFQMCHLLLPNDPVY